MSGVRGARATIVLDVWVLVLTALLCLPALTSAGLGLSGDLVFSPRQPLTLETLGLGGRLPRAVPLDAVVALLGHVVPGEVLFRLGVLAGLVLAGGGAHRLAAGCTASSRAAAAAFAVWNPFVVERLALGQWALLLAYGSLFFVAGAAVRAREEPTGRQTQSPPWSTWAWVGLASLTPTGGVLATVTAVALAGPRRARVALVAAGCVLLQLPWVLPSLLGTADGTADTVGVAAFRAQPDAPGGTLLSLLGLGGIWDLDSVPTSRTSLLGVAAALVVVALVVGAWRRLPAGAGPLVALAFGGLLLALAPRIPGLDALMGWVVAHLPGGGLLRDSQKWIAPLVVLASLSLAVSLDRLRRAAAGRGSPLAAVLVVIGVCVPFVLLPDATSKTWDAVRPVTYPREFSSIRDTLEAAPDSGAMVLLPWRSYRRFDWGNPRTAHDPAYAWFDLPMVGSDELAVGRRVVGDRDPVTERVRRAASAPDAGSQLAGLGVGWVLVYTDDPLTPALRLDGLEPVVGGRDVRLYRVGETVAPPHVMGAWRRDVVIGVDLLVIVAWLGSCVLGGRGAVRWYSATRRQTKV